jgi:hypothetical protein
VYGFGSDDTPGIETAEVINVDDPELARTFTVYTNTPDGTRQVLNMATVASLVDWARRYPLKTINSSNQVFTQLVVMYSPNGVYAASMGTMIPEAVEEMARLGTELVKSQGI